MASSMRFLCLALLFAVAFAGDSILIKGTNSFQGASIKDVDVANLISHISNVQAPQPFDVHPAFPEVDIFAAEPKANVFVVVEGLTADDVAHSTANLPFFSTGSAASVVTGADTISTITTMLTGVFPSTHGIVSAAWKSFTGPVEAFMKNGQCLAQSIPDTISFQSEGAATTFSISGDRQTAVALAVHPQMIMQHPEMKNNFAFAVTNSEVFDIFGDVRTNVGDSVQEIATSLRSVVRDDGLRQLVAEELYAVQQTPALFLNARGVGSDLAPEFIAVGITSVSKVANEYGHLSQQHIDVLELFDAALGEMYEEINAEFEQEVVAEVAMVQSAEQKATVAREAQQFINTSYVNDLQLTGAEVSLWQAFVWVSVFFIAFVTFGFCLMHGMDIDKESIVFRTVDGPREIPDVK